MIDKKVQESMDAVVLDKYDGVEALRMEQRPVPKPGKNEVLVKVSATPINPSDLAFIDGMYASQPPTPVIPGFEGSGTVVESGGSMMGNYLEGKKVAIIAQGGGTWSEYVVVNKYSALPLGKDVSLEKGAMSVVNPLTAIAFLEIAKNGQHKTIVQTAAAGALGQMVNRMCKNAGIQVVNIVRGQAQVEMLESHGEQIVLDSQTQDFETVLHEICKQKQISLAFDAIAGAMTMKIVEAMPPHSKVIVYGGLSYEPVLVDPGELIFRDKSIEGFWLTTWVERKSILTSMILWRRVQNYLDTDLKSEVRRRYPLQDVKNAIKDYQSQMTGGKILLKPGH